MTLANKRVQVARPTHEKSLAIGVVGTVYPAVGGTEVMALYVLDPERPIDIAKVESLLFSEAELEELAA